MKHLLFFILLFSGTAAHAQFPDTVTTDIRYYYYWTRGELKQLFRFKREADSVYAHKTDSSSFIVTPYHLNTTLGSFETYLDTKYQPAGSYLTSEVDGSMSNELQTLSIVGNNLTISGGNTIAVPTNTGPQGPQGIQGVTGATGSTGATGPAGTAPVWSKTALTTATPILVVDTFTITSSTPTVSFSAVLSAAGKTSAKVAAFGCFRSGATASNSPLIAMTAMSSTSATFLLTQVNTATVTILGINVLSGLPLVVVPDPVNVKIVLSLILY